MNKTHFKNLKIGFNSTVNLIYLHLKYCLAFNKSLHIYSIKLNFIFNRIYLYINTPALNSTIALLRNLPVVAIVENQEEENRRHLALLVVAGVVLLAVGWFYWGGGFDTPSPTSIDPSTITPPTPEPYPDWYLGYRTAYRLAHPTAPGYLPTLATLPEEAVWSPF